MDSLIYLYGPDIIDELRENDRKTIKFTVEGLKELEEECKRRIKAMQSCGELIQFDNPIGRE